MSYTVFLYLSFLSDKLFFFACIKFILCNKFVNLKSAWVLSMYKLFTNVVMLAGAVSLKGEDTCMLHLGSPDKFGSMDRIFKKRTLIIVDILLALIKKHGFMM